jgi:type II secretory pathway component PulF
MSLIVTPGQLAKRAEFYQQLGQLTAAGVGVVRALDQLKRHPPARSYREPIQRLLDEIGRGQTFTRALQNTTSWLPDLDLALLHAGEQSGRLDAGFHHLAAYYFDRARLARQVIAQLVYPVVLIHFAALVFSVVLPFASSRFNASLTFLFARAALTLAPFYLLTALLVFSLQGGHGEKWRSIIESFLRAIPILGTARHHLSLARLAASLEALISAGVNVIEAWGIAVAASGSPALRRAVSAWKPQLAASRTPAELVRDCPRFPEMFANLYATGEISGKLDESLRQLHTYYQEEGSRKLQLFAQLAIRVTYLVIVLIIAYCVITFYLGYFAQVREAGGF